MSEDDSLVDLIDREAVFNALNKAFDKIDRSFATKLQTRDRKQHLFLDRENKRLEAEVLALQQETSALREKVQELSAANNANKQHHESTINPRQVQLAGQRAHASNEDDGVYRAPTAQQLATNYARHSSLDPRPDEATDYERLKERYTLLRAANKLLKKEVREAQDKEEKWWHYAEVLEKELGILGNKEQTERRFEIAAEVMKRSRAERRTRKAAAISDRPTGTPLDIRPECAAAGPSANSSFNSDTERVAPQAPSGDNAISRSFQVNTAQPLTTRQPSPRSEAPTEEGSDHDEEPSLPAHANDETPKAHNTANIKQEPSSDPPVFLSARPVKKRRLAGDDLNRISTPSRRAVKDEVDQEDPAMYLKTMATLRKSPQESFDLDDGITEMPTPKKCRFYKSAGENHVSARSAAPTVESEQNEAPYLPLSDRTPRQPVIHDDMSSSDDAEKGRDSSPFGFQPLGALLNTPAEQRAKTNTLILNPFARREFEGRDSRGTAKEMGRGSKRKADGDTEIYQSPKPAPSFLPPSAQTPKQRPSPGVLSPRKPKTKAAGQSPAPHTTARKPLVDRSTNIQPRSRGPPLRSLPVDSLLLTDFRINPATNDNKDFAFDEVVRHKDDRAKMTGCTDPRCPRTKDMHAMVLAEVAHLTKEHGERFYQTPEGVTLVEKYLGDDAGRIPHMDVSERRTLWTQARLQQQANIYGRCRHRYDRGNTPEQYWDTGFPNTQEQERDREEGRMMDRRMVAVRRREALKKGGRWLFKDEYPSEANKRHRV
ncbi:hypothetical protein MGG_05993 [Pyricularia oryzae 70-15]|uniref:DNA endonuclease activator Ctp1 C-terminal domain-containing protein n=1 Tax=Pyricularia oryzae (strain 70-15 / ATCC MYA-4617 / FGSC 8958) TaxID=242507 RepID=G4N4L6_PYRO7|nr:uncharacterized protein MGG_05993 [Pyricularia oryzae 70-15]EHA52031.1 hypothetical protein MGG_05993 [Pyricularia oryzae 70-15]